MRVKTKQNKTKTKNNNNNNKQTNKKQNKTKPKNENKQTNKQNKTKLIYDKGVCGGLEIHILDQLSYFTPYLIRILMLLCIFLRLSNPISNVL